MSPKVIPERAPLGDSFSGVVLRVADGTGRMREMLSPAPLPGAEVILSGVLVIRYGVRYLEKPHLSIVPGLIALDYGDMLTSEEAWDFLMKRSNLHPRADVIGCRSDGVDEMIAVKKLDLAQAVEVLAYTDPGATVPSARPTALIAAETGGIAARILRHLPRYDTLAAWQQAINLR